MEFKTQTERPNRSAALLGVPQFPWAVEIEEMSADYLLQAAISLR